MGAATLVAGRLLNDLERGVELRLLPAATEGLAAGVKGPKPAPVPCDAGIPNTCLPLFASAMLMLQTAKPLCVLLQLTCRCWRIRYGNYLHGVRELTLRAALSLVDIRKGVCSCLLPECAVFSADGVIISSGAERRKGGTIPP